MEYINNKLSHKNRTKFNRVYLIKKTLQLYKIYKK